MAGGRSSAIESLSKSTGSVIKIPAMIEKQPRQPAYTNMPQPHRNFLVGSLQLIGWIIFRSSAWNHFVSCFDDSLAPDFTLIDLRRKHWKKAQLWRLLAQGFLVLPLLAGLLLAPVLYWVANVPADFVLGTALHYITIVLVMSLIFSLTISLAAGWWAV